MATLFTYLRMTQRLLREGRQELINPEDIIDYINRARREIANRTQCLRVTPPISGQIVSATVANPGSGYTAPTVSITPPDFPSGQLPSPNGAQATAGAVLSSGTIASVTIGFGGYGYFQPIISIVDPTGTGASITPVMSNMNLLQRGQERYDFANVDLSVFPGVANIISVRSVAIIYANYRYVIPLYPWTVYQGKIRQYPFQYQYVPTMGSQFGWGATGSLFLYPIASQTYQQEWDCACAPQDLIDDQSVEAIPLPWTDAVPFLAAAYGFMELQNFNSSRAMEDTFNRYLQSYSNAAHISRAVNIYGRY